MTPVARSGLRYAVWVACLAAVYWAAAWIGLRYVTIGHSVSLVWPPAGIAVRRARPARPAYLARGRRSAPSSRTPPTPVPLAARGGYRAGQHRRGTAGAAAPPAGGRIAAAARRPAPDAHAHLRRRAARRPARGGSSAWVTLTASTGALDSAGRLRGAARSGGQATCSGMLVVAPVLFSWAARPRIATTPAGCSRSSRSSSAPPSRPTWASSRASVPAVLQEVEYTYLLFPSWSGPRSVSDPAGRVARHARRWRPWRCGTRCGAAGRSWRGRPAAHCFAVACYLLVLAVTGLAGRLGGLVGARPRDPRAAAERGAPAPRARLRPDGDLVLVGGTPTRLVWDDNLRRLYGLGPGQTGGELRGVPRAGSSRGPGVRVPARCSAPSRTAASLDYEFRILLPDGRVRWIADQGRVGRDARGRPSYLTGVCMDVTERRSVRGASPPVAPHGVGRPPRRRRGTRGQQPDERRARRRAVHSPPLRSCPEAVRADVEHIRKAAERTSAVTAQLLAFSRRQILRPRCST